MGVNQTITSDDIYVELDNDVRINLKKSTNTYIGEWDNGLYNGVGLLFHKLIPTTDSTTDLDGSKVFLKPKDGYVVYYEGGFLNSKYHGKGILGYAKFNTLDNSTTTNTTTTNTNTTTTNTNTNTNTNTTNATSTLGILSRVKNSYTLYAGEFKDGVPKGIGMCMLEYPFYQSEFIGLTQYSGYNNMFVFSSSVGKIEYANKLKYFGSISKNNPDGVGNLHNNMLVFSGVFKPFIDNTIVVDTVNYLKNSTINTDNAELKTIKTSNSVFKDLVTVQKKFDGFLFIFIGKCNFGKLNGVLDIKNKTFKGHFDTNEYNPNSLYGGDNLPTVKGMFDWSCDTKFTHIV